MAIVLLASGCDGKHEPFARHIRGDIEPHDVPEIERVVYEFALKENLGLRPKNKRQMSALTDGKPAFSIFVYMPGYNDPIMLIGNVGVAKVISLSLFGQDERLLEESGLLYDKLLFSLLESGLVKNFKVMEKADDT